MSVQDKATIHKDNQIYSYKKFKKADNERWNATANTNSPVLQIKNVWNIFISKRVLKNMD